MKIWNLISMGIRLTDVERGNKSLSNDVNHLNPRCQSCTTTTGIIMSS